MMTPSPSLPDISQYELAYDGPVPSDIYSIYDAGGYAPYVARMAKSAERQFERMTRDTQQSIRHYRLLFEPIFSPKTLNHLSRDLMHQRDKAIESRRLWQKYG